VTVTARTPKAAGNGGTEPGQARVVFSELARALLFATGIAGISGGIYVVVAKQDGTATGALIAASFALLFLAAFGHRIESVRHGDTEVKLLLEGVKDAHARGDDDAHDALLAAAVKVAEASVGLSPDIRVEDETLVHDLAVVNALDQMKELHGTIVQSGRPVSAIATVEGYRIGIEPRHKMTKIANVVRRLREHERKAGALPIDALLVVARLDPGDPRLVERANQLRLELGIPVLVVPWEVGDEPDPLHQAARELLEARHGSTDG
jgi:hypothetical protein